jgi:thioredoxin-like negative regulator of GroEL
MKSTLTEITGMYEGRMRFALLPEREAKDSFNRYGILTLPTCLVFDRSKLVDRFIGTLSKEKLIERLDSILVAL